MVNARSQEEVAAAFEVARAFADHPAASPSGEPRFVFVTGFNAWHEGTTVEPTVDPPAGAATPGGPYGFAYLEALRRVFRPER